MPTLSIEWCNFWKSPWKVYGAHTLAFQAYISNFIPFGQEMADRNDAEVCSTEVINENQSCPGTVLFWPFIINWCCEELQAC